MTENKITKPTTAPISAKNRIDPKTIVLDDTPSSKTPTAPSTPDEGGKGGVTSNASFMAAVFRDLPDGATALVCSKSGDPTGGGWHALSADNVGRDCPPSRNNYFNCSSFLAEEGGEVKARKEKFAAFHALVFDDVGTKVDRAKFDGVTPSWEIETSPGNAQIGIILDTPINDERLVKQLQDAVITAGLCDPGAGGPARWARLPVAINGKEKYRDNSGTPFACRLAQYNPDVRMRPEDIAEALGFTLLPPSTGPVAPFHSKSFRHPIRTGDDIYQPIPLINPVLLALREKGLYKSALGDGRHDITCPWVDEHTDEVDSGSAYFEPSRDFPVGGFRCQHSHGDRYHIGELLSFLGIDRDAARCKPSIRNLVGESHRVLRAAEMVLADMGNRFQAGGSIVKVLVDPHSGAIRTEALNEQSLLSDLSEGADWYRQEKGAKGWTRIDPPTRIVQMLLKADSYEHLPALSGVARQPYFMEGSNRLITEPGYKPESRLYGHFNLIDFPLPEPTLENAHTALNELKRLLCEFHFESETDLSAALSSILTAVIRPSLPVAPAFNITASGPGSGKSYLTTLVARFVGPGAAKIASYPLTKDEAEKFVFSLFLEHPAVIIFDDMQGDWIPHAKMNSALTSPTITGRILGMSKTVDASTRSLVLGSGNNVEPVRDMCRRVVTVRLTPPAQSAVTWRYKFNPQQAVEKNRCNYVAHALTIIRAWLVADCPKADVPPVATYERWSELCRQPLLWLGLADPAGSLISQVMNDPDAAQLGALLKTWHGIFGEQSITVRKLLEKAADHLDLDDQLSELPIAERGIVNRSRLGWYLAKHKGRIFGDLQLLDGSSSERKSWRVVKVAKGEAPSSPPSIPLAA